MYTINIWMCHGENQSENVVAHVYLSFYWPVLAVENRLICKAIQAAVFEAGCPLVATELHLKKKKRQMTAFACHFRPLSAFTTCIELQVTKAGEKWPQTGADTSLSPARHIPPYRPAFLRCSSAHLAVFVINHHIMRLHVSMHDSHTVTIVQSLLKKKATRHIWKENRSCSVGFWTADDSRSTDLKDLVHVEPDVIVCQSLVQLLGIRAKSILNRIRTDQWN